MTYTYKTLLLVLILGCSTNLNSNVVTKKYQSKHWLLKSADIALISSASYYYSKYLYMNTLFEMNRVDDTGNNILNRTLTMSHDYSKTLFSLGLLAILNLWEWQKEEVLSESVEPKESTFTI